MVIRALPRLLASLAEKNLNSCRNLGLILDKYQPWMSENGGKNWELCFKIQQLKQQNKKKVWVDKITKGNEAKGHWLVSSPAGNNVSRIDPILNPNHKMDSKLYLDYFHRWKNTLNLIGGTYFPMKNISRIVIGLGGKGTLEMGITLHHPAGFPIIPGSALKGLARTRALYRLAEEWGIPAVDNTEIQNRQKTPLQKLEKLLETEIGPADDPHRLDALENNLRVLQQDPSVMKKQGQILKVNAPDLAENKAFLKFRQIFGSPSRSGEVIFFGGMCENTPIFTTEIMTPHYKKYNIENKFPRDDDSPQPNVYLALETNQIFWFGLAPRLSSTPPGLVKAAGKYLKLGLQELGLGAKTSSGMGLFETISTGGDK